MSTDIPQPPSMPNEWRETVRTIFDTLHFAEDGLFSGNPLAVRLLHLIEDRHHAYFCEGKTVQEWEAIKNADGT